MKKDDLHEELRGIAPELQKLKGDNPFSVPEGYFENLPHQIQQKRAATQKRPLGQGAYWGIPRMALAGVTALMLIVAGYFYISNSYLQQNDFAANYYFEDYLGWNAEFQSGYFYDMYADDMETFFSDPQEIDEELLEYIMDYGDYYLESPLAIVAGLE